MAVQYRPCLVYSHLDTFEFDPATHQLKLGFMARVHFNQCKKKFKDSVNRLADITGLPVDKKKLRSKLILVVKFLLKKLSAITKGESAYHAIVEEMDKVYDLPLLAQPSLASQLP